MKVGNLVQVSLSLSQGDPNYVSTRTQQISSFFYIQTGGEGLDD